MTGRPIGEDDLHAFIDGQLDPARHREVEAWLIDHPEQMRRTDALRADRDALRLALDPVAAEPIPSRLNPARLTEIKRNTRLGWWRPLGAIAASLLLVGVGGGGGWMLRGLSVPPQNGVGALAREAADSYAVFAADTRRPVELTALDGDALGSWVDDRLGRRTTVPDLRGAGYRLLGGRVVATPHGPAGLFLYQSQSGQRLGVFVRPMEIDRTAHMAEHGFGRLQGYSWADHGLGYSLVGTEQPENLHPIANAIRKQTEQL